MRVRWNQFAGMTEWQTCQAVQLRGPWLRVQLDENNVIMVPDHIVRGRVEVDHEGANGPHDRPMPTGLHMSGKGNTRRSYQESADKPREGMTLAELQGFCRRAELAGVQPWAIPVVKTSWRATVKSLTVESNTVTTTADLESGDGDHRP